MLESGPLGCLLTGGALAASNMLVKDFLFVGCAVTGKSESSVKLNRCIVYRGAWSGVCARGSQSKLYMEGGTVSQGHMCVDVYSRAHAQLHNVMLSNSEYRVSALSKDTKVEIFECRSKGA